MRALLSYAQGVDASLLVKAVQDASWEVWDSFKDLPATPLLTRDAIASADAVIVAGGVPGSPETGALFLELGVALGLNKPVLLIWDELAAPPSGLPPELRTARISLRNLDALRFHISVFLADVAAGSKAARSHRAVHASPGDASRLAARLDELQTRPLIDEADFIRWIDDVFRSVGSKSVPTRPGGDRGFDLVLSAPPAFDIDGPVLVEAKVRWLPTTQLRRLVERLSNVVASERASLGIIVILARPDAPRGGLVGKLAPTVSVFTARDLLERVASRGSLADVQVPPGWSPESNL